MPKLREHLGRTIAIFPRLRRQVSELGIVGFGEKFAEMLRRKPSKRATYGIEKLDQKGYDRAQGIGEAVAAQFSGAMAELTEEYVATIEAAMKVRASEQSVFAALGANLTDEIRNTMPALSRGDSTIANAADADLLAARDLWTRMHVLDGAARELPPDHPLRDILLRMADGHDSAFGLVLLTIVVQKVRAAGFSDPVERFDAAFRPRPEEPM